MEVRADKAKVWRKDFKTKDGKEFCRYTVSISKKVDEDGKTTWVNAYIPVMFSKKSNPPAKIENGAMVENLVGFMSVDSYKDKDGNERNTPMIVVMSADFDSEPIEADGFEQAEEDIPF